MPDHCDDALVNRVTELEIKLAFTEMPYSLTTN
jgi:uncharacterized coiled-coil protein SlyX